MKYFAASDVHDHYNLLIDVLKSNGFDENDDNHKLIVCGDAFYSGPEPGELFEYLFGLFNKDKLIFIKGNHDVELLDNLKAGEFKRSGNRTCASKVVEYITCRTNLSDSELIAECKNHGFVDFLEHSSVWFYETDKYIFTHGFIPTYKNEYKTDWRLSNDSEWRNAASRGDAMMLTMKYGIYEPNKTIVCGHYSSARFYLMKHASQDDWKNKIYKDVSKVPTEGFKTYISDGIIALDASTKKTGFINCFVIED